MCTFIPTPFLILYTMKKWLSFFTISLYAGVLFSQTYFNKLLDTPYPYLGAVVGAIETPDAGFILAHISFDIFQYAYKMNIIKIDKLGNTVWEKSYGAAGTANEQKEIIRTSDSCYVICGGKLKPDTTSAFLFKINEQGDSLWMKTYNPGRYLCFFETLIETSDGGLLATGGTTGNPKTDPNPWGETYTVKTDRAGKVIWALNRGYRRDNDSSFGIVETPDHQYLQCGNTQSPYDQDFFVHPTLTKIDNNGKVVWEKKYTYREYNESFTKIARTLDGNYLLSGGYNNNRDVLSSDPNGGGGTLMKIDERGETIWFKRHGDKIFDAECYDFVELPDSSIVTIGFSFYPDDNSAMVKFSSTGDIQWVRRYRHNNTREVSEGLYKIIHTQDNGFFMCGQGNPPILNTPLSVNKGWILKLYNALRAGSNR